MTPPDLSGPINILTIMGSDFTPSTLEEASEELQALMQTSYHPVYRLHEYDHLFADDGSGRLSIVMLGNGIQEDVGAVDGNPDEIHRRYLQLSEIYGAAEEALTTEGSGPAAAWAVDDLMPEAGQRLHELIGSGQTFVTEWWTCNSQANFARCGRSGGNLWVGVRGEQDMEALAEAAVRRVVNESPLDVEDKLRELSAEMDDSMIEAIVGLRGITIDELNVQIQQADFPDLFDNTQVIDEYATYIDPDGFERRHDVMELVRFYIQEEDKAVNARMRQNYDDLTALVRGDLYRPEQTVSA